MRSLTRRDFLRAAGAAAAAASLPWACRTPGSGPRADDPPNIVYILADDMGYGDVACLNPDSKIPTPHLDRLAREGMRFTDAHSPSAVCTPTRYSLLTGRYCWRSVLKKSVLWPWDGPLIEPGRLTAGALLKAHGYATACIGKWHLGWDWPTSDGSRINDELAPGVHHAKKRTAFGKNIDFSRPINGGPTARGFDYYFGDDVPNFPPYCFIENDCTLGIPDADKPEGMFGHDGPMQAGWDLEDVLPALAQKAVDYIEAPPGAAPFNKAQGRPFFLYFPLTAPHTPIAPDVAFQGKSAAGRYGDFVCQVDDTVGRVMKALKETGQDQSTLVIFTSDNGSPGRDGTGMSGPVSSVRRFGHNPSHIFRGTKADIWDGGHRVPFFARWPGHIAAGSTSGETVCHADLMATCADLLGSRLPDDAGEDSFSILPILLGDGPGTPARPAVVHHSSNGMFAVRQGKWKLVLGRGSGGWSGGGGKDDPPGQLYDLAADPSEKNNLYERHPGVVERLSGLLETFEREGRSRPRSE